jgi:outer membrane protein assembly factor BamB
VNSEMLSAAAIERDTVVVRAVDGRVIALRLADGEPLWSAEQAVPRLSLRGVATPVISGDLTISGFDNGRALALSLRDGSTVWEATVSPPSGRTELERLIDVDSAVRVDGDDVFAVTYQGRVARLARDTGQVWWTRDLSSYRGLDVDAESVFVSTSEGEVVKMGRRTGVEVWRQEGLSRRRLSAPTIAGPYLIVGDFEGYVHFLSADTGNIVARQRAGDGRIAARIVPVGELVLVFNDEGSVTALRVPQMPAGADVAPAPAKGKAAAPTPAAAPDAAPAAPDTP